MATVSQLFHTILPQELQLHTIAYLKPNKIEENMKNELESEYVYRLFKRTYDEFVEDLNTYNEEQSEAGNIGTIEESVPPYLPFMFEYLVDCMPHENYKHYIKCLRQNKKHPEEAEYFIKAIKLAMNWEQHNTFYDDDEYYLFQSMNDENYHYYDVASEI